MVMGGWMVCCCAVCNVSGLRKENFHTRFIITCTYSSGIIRDCRQGYCVQIVDEWVVTDEDDDD